MATKKTTTAKKTVNTVDALLADAMAEINKEVNKVKVEKLKELLRKEARWAGAAAQVRERIAELAEAETLAQVNRIGTKFDLDAIA